MTEVSFKERVKNVAILQSKLYNEKFVNYEYLVCSDAFTLNKYYIIDANEDNYQHLIGVHSLISSQDFFDKCYNGTLQESDFDFIKRFQTEKSVIGSVRRKILVLPDIMNIFSESDIMVEEIFVKNNVHCSFATTNNKCTLGFINALKSYPKTLLRGNELNSTKARKVNLLLRKETGTEKFSEILIGNTKILMSYYDIIKDEIDTAYGEVAAAEISIK